MTPDEPDEQLAPLAPADEARIRALLSDARQTGAMPAPVAARLDEAIVGLAAERARAVESGYAPNVRPLVRTRRHRVVAVLGAAAAVAVVGLAIGAFFDSDDQAAQDATSADTGVDRGTDVGAEREAPEEADNETAAPETKRNDPGFVTSVDDVFAVHSRQLGSDLSRIRDEVLADPRTADYAAVPTYAPDTFTCRSVPVSRAVLVGVRYNGTPAYAAFQEPMGDAQVVELLQCGTGDVLRSTTLPLAD